MKLYSEFFHGTFLLPEFFLLPLLNESFVDDKKEFRATTGGHLKENVESIHEDVHYPCGQCDCRVTTKGKLKEHVRSIQEGVSYPCDQYYYSMFSL